MIDPEMAGRRRLLTIDLNIARDYLDPRRRHHEDAVALFALNGDSIELAIGPHGLLLDIERKSALAQELAELIRRKNIRVLRQLAYLTDVTFPSRDLYPGTVVPGFRKDWATVLRDWRTNEGAPPKPPDDFHIEAHLLDQRDVFLTRDRGLRAMCQRLQNEFSYPINAMTAEEYLGR